MMFGLVTLVHLADSKEQLDSDTETLYSTARNTNDVIKGSSAGIVEE